MNFAKELRRLRVFLRDPDGNIWDRSLLLNLYNDAQREIQIKTRYIESIRTLRVPPLYHASYLFDWEWPYLSTDQNQFYKALKDFQQGDFVHCYQWEAALDFAYVPDDGAHFTQPWEAFFGTPGDQVKIKFPSNFHTAKFFAYDRLPIEYRTKKEIQLTDTGYINRTGKTFAYYREDDLDNSFIPYPLPSSVDWFDLDETSSDTEYVYSHSWESDFVTGEKFTDEDEDNDRDYIYSWETGTLTGKDSVGHGMWLFEAQYQSGGMVTSVSTDTTPDTSGTFAYRIGSLDSQSFGIAVDVIEADNNFVLIYDAVPTDIRFDGDESDYPVFLRKYVEHLVLSRAYRVNNDGNIKSLAEYWDYRANVGLEMIKKYMTKRYQDRDFRLLTKGTPVVSVRRHPKLPSTYPAI